MRRHVPRTSMRPPDRLWVARPAQPARRGRGLALVLALVMTLAVMVWPDTAAPQEPETGLWLSGEELAALPMSGAGWEALSAAAAEPLSQDTNLAARDDHNVRTLAVALVAARADDDAYRAKARDALAVVVEAEPDTGDVLAAARRLSTYVIAADLIGLSELDPDLAADFRRWARRMLEVDYSGGGGGGTIAEVHERRPNNFGTHAGASRVAVAAYLGDQAELDRAAAVFKGWLGDRARYQGFEFGDLSWQADPDRPVAVNPAGSSIDGHSVDGVLPDDQRRGGDFTWPPPKENYVWGALQGATVQAELLDRQGYDAWQWEDSALLRATTWLHEQADFPATGDDSFVPWLVNHAYDTDFPAEPEPPVSSAAVDFTDWTHAHEIGIRGD